MKPLARHTIPVLKARELIAELRIEDPSEIEIHLIAAHLDVIVQEKEMHGSDGRMMRIDGVAMISVRESIAFSGQKRFVIAHELGHVLLHPKVRQIDELSLAQASNWSLNQEPEEIEANLFAAEILMPQSLFLPRIQGREPGFALFKELAAEFGTTLTAVAIQFIRYTKEECVIVASRNGQRKWFHTSGTFGFRLRDETDVHKYSCAFELEASKESAVRGDDVPAGCWLHGYSTTDNMECVTEDAIWSKAFGALSLIWIKDDI